MARRKDPAAVRLGRRGGQRGGPARAAALSPERATEIARVANRCRYDLAYRLEHARRRLAEATTDRQRERARLAVEQAEQAIEAEASSGNDPLGAPGRAET